MNLFNIYTCILCKYFNIYIIHVAPRTYTHTRTHLQVSLILVSQRSIISMSNLKRQLNIDIPESTKRNKATEGIRQRSTRTRTNNDFALLLETIKDLHAHCGNNKNTKSIFTSLIIRAQSKRLKDFLHLHGIGLGDEKSQSEGEDFKVWESDSEPCVTVEATPTGNLIIFIFIILP